MLDLIRRKDAINVLQEEINKFIPPLNDSDWWMRYGIRLSRNIIEDLPTVGSIPVKTGEWIDPAAANCYRCSVCEEYTTMEMPRPLYHYCPNCGSRMEGKDG